MKNQLTRRSLLAGVAVGAATYSTSCTTLRCINPILASNDLLQRMFVGLHLDAFALMIFGTVLASPNPYLSANRALGVLAFFLFPELLFDGAAATTDTARIAMTLDDNTLVIINPENGAVLSKVTLGQQPSLIAAPPNGQFLAITNAASHSVSIVTTADSRLSKTIQLESGSAPYGVAVSEDGKKVYVANEARNSISVIDVAAGQVVATISTPGTPSKIAISPDGSLLWAPTASGAIYVIDTLSDTVSTVLRNVPNPVAVAFNPTGTRAYVTSAPAATPGSVVVLNTGDYSILTRIAVGTNPYSIVLSSGGTFAYVSNFDSNSVSVIDAVNDQVVRTIATGKAPIEVAIFS